MKIYYYIIFFVGLSNNFLFSQSNDSLVLISHKYDSILHDDSKAFDFLFYKHKDDVLINNLGTYNSSNYLSTASGIYSATYFKNHKKLIFVDLLSIKPFTNISYVNASRKEQVFSIKHNQRFGKAIGLGFYLNKTSSPGDYVNQAVNASEFLVDFNFENKKKNYKIDFNFSYFRLKQEENGGLTNINEFEDNLIVSPLSATLNLQSSNVQKTVYNYVINQRLNVLKYNKKDVFLDLNSSYSTKQRMFFDNNPLSSFYNDVFIDTLATVDSLFSNSIENKLGVGLRTNNEVVEFFTSYSFNNYFQSFGLDTSFSNTFVGGVIKKKVNKFGFNLMSKYGVNGYRKDDFYTDLLLSYNFTKQIKTNIHTNYSLTEPDLKHVNYSSNHFKWENYDFSKQAVASIDVGLVFEKYKIELNGNVKFINDAIYYNFFGAVAQYNDAAMFSTFHLSKKYKFYKFHFKTALIYQTTSNDFLFPLPDFIGRQLVYFESFAFKKVLKFQFGFNVSYTSSYYGYAYSPALTEFHIQNTNKIGDYPFVDVFLNFHLKRAQIFLKYEHINSGWNGYEFYATANYPALARSLKFGISWNLVD